MSSEIAIRLSFFFLIFAIIAIWELLAPRRALSTSKTSRWLSNLAITFLNPATERLVFPILAVSMALKAQQYGWGLLNHYNLPFWPAMVVAVVVLDFATYLQHVMFHAVPLLWRLHMVHHADLDFDVTTGLRFHPIEMILSMGIKLAVVVVFGPPAMAVLTFEVILNATAMFNHGNIYLPLRIDQVLRLLIVTPDMHRVHHSVLPREANSNFGFNLPWWDRLFGTYRHQPTEGHEGMSIGLRQFQEPGRLTFPWLLILPLTGKTDNYPIGGRGQRP
jgi:sterol desaturase/sphingolipid hydroxylase (fatty acid hydroxylase superfamily)